MAKGIRVSRYLHFCFKEVPAYYKDTPEKCVNLIALETDATVNWDQYYKRNYGKLLRVMFVTELLKDFDPVLTEVEILREAMTHKQAEVQMELKEMQDRINDLLLIGYDAGSVTVITDVEAKPATPEVDDDFPL